MNGTVGRIVLGLCVVAAGFGIYILSAGPVLAVYSRAGITRYQALPPAVKAFYRPLVQVTVPVFRESIDGYVAWWLQRAGSPNGVDYDPIRPLP